MEYNFYYLAAYFFIYAFLGWALEVAYHAVCKGVVVNRGFLNGPVCPIYGVGVVAVLVVLEPYKDNLLLLYLGGVLFTSMIELVGGWVLYKAFDMRWWDYSKEPFNLGGFVCLKFSLAWGVCIILVVQIIQPLIEFNVTLFMDLMIGHILLFGALALFAADSIETVIMVMHLNRELKEMNAITREIRKFSDALTIKIADKSMQENEKFKDAKQSNVVLQGEEKLNKLKKFSVQAKEESEEEIRKLLEKSLQVKNSGDLELQNLRKRTADAIAEKEEKLRLMKEKFANHIYFGYGRFYRAFPGLHSTKYDEEWKSVADRMSEHMGKKNS